MKYKLYGDAVHDDTDALQEMLSSGGEVTLSAPPVAYTVSRTLYIPSDTHLSLPRNAVIRLADGANCLMIENMNKVDGDRNIRITGGIWDFNNMGQRQNPYHDTSFHKAVNDAGATLPYFAWDKPYFWDYPYLGVGMRFSHIDGFCLSDMTLKDPVTFAVHMAYVVNFEIRNILFDFNFGNPPVAINMDGIHMEGGCYHGLIENLSGDTNDDMVAFNIDELCPGDSGDIVVKNIRCDRCLQAVRFLSLGHILDGVTIENVEGRFYGYCVGFTKAYHVGNKDYIGRFRNITLRDLRISKSNSYANCVRTPDYVPWQDEGCSYPLVWFQNETKSENIVIENLFRNEMECEAPTIAIRAEAEVNGLTLKNIRSVSAIDKTFEDLVLSGRVHNLSQ